MIAPHDEANPQKRTPHAAAGETSVHTTVGEVHAGLEDGLFPAAFTAVTR